MTTIHHHPPADGRYEIDADNLSSGFAIDVTAGSAKVVLFFAGHDAAMEFAAILAETVTRAAPVAVQCNHDFSPIESAGATVCLKCGATVPF